MDVNDMSRINVKKVSDKPVGHVNSMGGTSYFVNPLLSLRMAAASCFFGEPKFYADKVAEKKATVNTAPTSYFAKDVLQPLVKEEYRTLKADKAIEVAIDNALDYDFEGTLKIAVELRNTDNIRTTPQVILVRAANRRDKPAGVLGKYAQDIIKRVDEAAVGMAYQIGTFGKPIPVSLRKAWKKALESANDYSLAKYRMENRVVKTVDVVNMVHANSPSIDKLMKGELKNTETWEAVISAKGNNKEAWESVIPKMGHMALLRNLRNFLNANVDMKPVLRQLEAGVIGGKQLPFRYWNAYKQMSDNLQVAASLERCIETAIENLPKFKGKTMSLVDNSGSAQSAKQSEMGTMPVSEIGNITGVLTAKASEHGYVGVFGDRLAVTKVGVNDSTFSTLKDMNKVAKEIGQSTENGVWLFFRDAIAKKEHWDNIFIYSDMQAGHGGLYGVNASEYKDYLISGRYIDVNTLVKKYRETVNPKVNVFLVQIAGYQDTLMPELYNRTFILGGWSSGLIEYAKKLADLMDQQEQ